MSIEDLLAKVRKRSPRVGYATVYRTLKLLDRLRHRRGAPVRRRPDPLRGDGRRHGHHDHLICVQCGLILEFENDTIEQLQDEMADKLGGFKLVQAQARAVWAVPQGGRRQERLLPERIRQGAELGVR